MTFKRFNRRTHLYLAMALMPWVAIYALSGLFFNHGKHIGQLLKPDGPEWVERFSKSYELPEGVDPKADATDIATAIVDDLGFHRVFWANRHSKGQQLDIHVMDMIAPTRLTYRFDDKVLRAEDKVFRADHFFHNVHLRARFHHDSTLNDIWAVIVDVFCVAIMIWVVSGVVMWVQQSRQRLWGGIALGLGVVSFAVFMAVM